MSSSKGRNKPKHDESQHDESKHGKSKHDKPKHNKPEHEKSKNNKPKHNKTAPAVSQKDQRRMEREQQAERRKELQAQVEQFDATSKPGHFRDLPLSVPTRNGLNKSHYIDLTDIQSQAIPVALKGTDVLGAAKTGSGKTLAFLVPLLEKLYSRGWTRRDGLGALVITPTRELANQIFEVLKKIGRFHEFSAGVVVGGRKAKEEADYIGAMSILVATPGRLKEHLDGSASLDVTNLQLLVLDEADRLMDEGFEEDMDAIVQHLPPERQVLMFSATQKHSVKLHKRLGLHNAEFISVHEDSATATPNNMQQYYIVVPLSDKLETLYFFIRSNLEKKILVFFASSKQVRYVYEAFCQLQPGMPLMEMRGRQKQDKRETVMRKFRDSKNACMFATDVLARGLDIPQVDWVLQVDCPETIDTYIHRSGRTARYENHGSTLLFLDPTEEGPMVDALEKNKVPIESRVVRKEPRASITSRLQDMCTQDNDMKVRAQKAFQSYTEATQYSFYTKLFGEGKLDLEAFAISLGLSTTPAHRRKNPGLRGPVKAKNVNRRLEAILNGTDEAPKNKEVRTKADKMFGRINPDLHNDEGQKHIRQDDESDDDDEDFFTIKRVMDDEALAEAAAAGRPKGQKKPKTVDLGSGPIDIDSKKREKMVRNKQLGLKYRGTSKKTLFDDDGKPHPQYELQSEASFYAGKSAETQRADHIGAEAKKMRIADAQDKARVREQLREKRRKRKAMEREEGQEGPVAAERPSEGRFGDDGDDGLVLLRSLPMAGSEKEKEEKGEKGDRPQKRRKRRSVAEAPGLPDCLADLEAMAADLLDG